jgi:hypothetical protein
LRLRVRRHSDCRDVLTDHTGTLTQRHPALGVIAHEYVPAFGCHHEVCELAEFLLYMVAVGRPGADLETGLAYGEKIGTKRERSQARGVRSPAAERERAGGTFPGDGRAGAISF